MPLLPGVLMVIASLLRRQQRMEMREKMIKQNYCPNCNVPLREKIQGGTYCSKCNWENKK
jgi:uncharacterized Zn finger protein (UPF0148 family)